MLHFVIRFVLGAALYTVSTIPFAMLAGRCIGQKDRMFEEVSK